MRTIELAITIANGFTADIEKNYRIAKSKQQKIIAYLQVLFLKYVYTFQNCA